MDKGELRERFIIARFYMLHGRVPTLADLMTVMHDSEAPWYKQVLYLWRRYRLRTQLKKNAAS